MAQKIKKSKGRGRKPKGTVSSKQEATSYDRTREALKVKMNENSYLQVLGIKKQAVVQRINEPNHVINRNLLVTNVPEDTLQKTLVLTQVLKNELQSYQEKNLKKSLPLIMLQAACPCAQAAQEL